jgi:hypothetical protein
MIVRTENLIAGMVLGCDVKDRSGRLLLRRGIKLVQKHLLVLKTWGVPEVRVKAPEGVSQDAAGESAPGADAAQLEEARSEIRPLFVHADLTHPLTKALFELRALQIVRGRNGNV